MTNAEKALAYLQLQKMDDKLDDIAIQETAQLYNMPLEEVQALMRQLQKTPQYNKAITYSAGGKIGGIVYVILIAAISIGIARSEDSASVLYGAQGIIYALLALGGLIGLVVQLAEIRPVEQSKAVELSGFKRTVNRLLVFRHSTPGEKVFLPGLIAIFTLLSLLYISIIKPYEMHEKDWRLYRNVTLQEDCKRVIRKLHKSTEDYYTVRLNEYTGDYKWDKKDHLFAFMAMTPEVLQKGDKIDIYTNKKNAVYDIVKEGAHFLNLEQRNKQAGQQTLLYVGCIGGIMALTLACAQLSKPSSGAQ